MTSSKQDSNTIDFENFRKNFQKLKLPIEIKKETDNLSFDKKLNSKYFQDQNYDYYAIGEIETKENFILLLSFQLVEGKLPILSTFSNSGVLIDEKMVAIGRCGPGPGGKCEEYLNIDKNLNIHIVDSIAIWEFDEELNELPNTRKNSIVYKKGKVNAFGIINLSEEIESKFD